TQVPRAFASVDVPAERDARRREAAGVECLGERIRRAVEGGEMASHAFHLERRCLFPADLTEQVDASECPFDLLTEAIVHGRRRLEARCPSVISESLAGESAVIRERIQAPGLDQALARFGRAAEAGECLRAPVRRLLARASAAMCSAVLVELAQSFLVAACGERDSAETHS